MRNGPGFASTRLRGVLDVVFAAIQVDSLAVQFAAPELRGTRGEGGVQDWFCVTAAMHLDWRAVQFALNLEDAPVIPRDRSLRGSAPPGLHAAFGALRR